MIVAKGCCAADSAVVLLLCPFKICRHVLVQLALQARNVLLSQPNLLPTHWRLRCWALLQHVVLFKECFRTPFFMMVSLWISTTAETTLRGQLLESIARVWSKLGSCRWIRIVHLMVVVLIARQHAGTCAASLLRIETVEWLLSLQLIIFLDWTGKTASLVIF